MTAKERIQQMQATASYNLPVASSASDYNLPVASSGTTSATSVKDRVKNNTPAFSDNTYSLFSSKAPNEGGMTPAWAVNQYIASDEDNNASRRQWAQTGRYDPAGTIAAERKQQAAAKGEAVSSKSLSQIRQEVEQARTEMAGDATAKQTLKIKKILAMLDEAQETAANAGNAKEVAQASAEIGDKNFTDAVSGTVALKATGRDDLKAQALATQENENAINAANDANRLSQLKGDSADPEKAKAVAQEVIKETAAKKEQRDNTTAQIAAMPKLKEAADAYDAQRSQDAKSYNAITAAQNVYTVPSGLTAEQGQTWLYLMGSKREDDAETYKTAVTSYKASERARTQKALADEMGSFDNADVRNQVLGAVGLSSQIIPKKLTQDERWKQNVQKESASKSALEFNDLDNSVNLANPRSAEDLLKNSNGKIDWSLDTGYGDKNALISSKIQKYTSELESDGNAAAFISAAYKAHGKDDNTKYMSGAEKVVYFYNLGKYGQTRADAFAATIKTSLDQRKAAEKAKKTQEYYDKNWITKLAEYPASLSIGFAGGLSGYFTNVKQSLLRAAGFTASVDDTALTLFSQYYALSEDNKAKKISYDLGSAVGQNIVPIILAVATSGLSNAALGADVAAKAAKYATRVAFGTSVFGGAYQQARAQGNSDDASMVYSAAITASELGLEYLLGGISGLAGEGELSDTMLQGLTSAANKMAKTASGRAALRGAAVILSQAVPEFIEETVQGLLEPAVSNVILGTDEKVDVGEALYEGVLGAMNALILNVPSEIKNSVYTNKIGKSILSDGTALESILKEAESKGSAEQRQLASDIRSSGANAKASDVGALMLTIAAREASELEDGVPDGNKALVGTSDHYNVLKESVGVSPDASPSFTSRLPDGSFVYTYTAVDENGVQHTFTEAKNGTRAQYWTDTSPAYYEYDQSPQTWTSAKTETEANTQAGVQPTTQTTSEIDSAQKNADSTGSKITQQTSDVSLPSKTKAVSTTDTIGTQTESDANTATAANTDITSDVSVNAASEAGSETTQELSAVQEARTAVLAETSGEKINSYDDASIRNADAYDALAETVGAAVDVRSGWGDSSYEDGAIVLDAKRGMDDAAPVAVAVAMLKNGKYDTLTASLLREYDNLSLEDEADRLDKADAVNRLATVVRRLYTNPAGFAEFIGANKDSTVAVRNFLKKFNASIKGIAAAKDTTALAKAVSALTAAIDNQTVNLPGVKKEAAQNTPKPAENKETSPVKKTNASSEGKDTTQTKPSERKGEVEEKQKSVEVKKTEEKEKPKLPTKAAAKPKTAETEKAENVKKNPANAETEAAAEAPKKEAAQKEAPQKKAPQKSPAEKAEGKPKLPTKETEKKSEGKERTAKLGSDTTQTAKTAEKQAAPVKKAKAEGSAEAQKKKQEHAKKIANYYGAANYKDEATISLLLINSDGNSRFISVDPDVHNGGTELSNRDSLLLRVDSDDLSEYYKRGQGTRTAVSAQTLSNRVKNGLEQEFDKERYRLARYIERAEKAKADALLLLSERAYQAKTGNVDDVYFKAGDAWYNIRRSTMDMLDGADTLFLLPGVHSEKGKTSSVLIAKDANGSVSGVVILSNRGNADGNESGGKSVSVDMDGSVVIRSVSGKNTKTSKGEPYREGYFKNAGEVQKIRAFAASVFEEETGETLPREQKPINRIFESDEAFFKRGSASNTTGASDALDAIRKIVSERTRVVRRGKLSSHTTAGQYSEGTEVIRLRDAKNIRTLLHEFGHRIDHEQNISPLFREVLESIVPERVANTYAARGDDVSKEGFAEFYLQYVTDKAYAEELSPQIVAWLDEHLTEDNRVASDSIRDQWSLYAQRDSLGRLKSAVEGAEKLKDRKAVRLPGSMRLVDKLKMWAVDSFTGLRRFEQEAENRGNDAPVVLPSTFVRNLSSVQARTAQLIDGDRFYTMGNRVVSDTRTERQIYEKAIDYAKENVKTGRYKDEQDYMDTLNAYLVLGSALGWNEQLLTDKDFVPMRFFADKSIDPTNKQTYLKMMDIFNTLTLQNPEFLEIRRQLHSLILDVYKYYAVYSGKMSVSEFREMQKNPLYIPLNRVMEDTAYDGVNKSGIPTDAPILHRIKGSTRSVQDPFVNIARQIDSVVKASYEHRAVKSIFDMADRINNSAEFGSGVGDYIERVRPDREKVVVNAFEAKADLLSELKGKKYDDASLAEISEAWDSAIGPTVSNWRMVTDNRRGSNTVVFRDNGTYKAYVVGEAVLSALKNVNPAPLNSFLQVVSRMKRFYTALLTSLNPMFAIGSNAPRDAVSALIQSGEKNPVRFAAHYLSSLSESAKSYVKGKPSSNEMALFASLGGMSLSELSQTKDPQRYQRYITDKFSRSMDSDAKNKLRSVSPERVIDAIEKFNNVIEAAPRFSEFKRVLEETGSVDNAMLAAKEVTTNFETRGSGIRGFLSFIPFGNAGIQGVYRAYKTLIEGEAYDARSKAQVRAGAWAKLSAIASTAAIEVALLSLIDDDEKKAYQNLSSYVKNNYFVVPKGNGEFLTIKKPENYSVIISLAERLAEWTIGQNPEAWYGFLGYAWEQLVPIIPSPFEENNDLTLSGASQSVIGGLVGDVIIVGTLFDLFVTNKNYRGSPIVPTRLQDRAGAQQVDASTSWLANFVAQGLNSLFNTDKASPMKLDYAIQNNFGFLATLNANFTVPDDWAEAVSSGKGEDLNKVFPNVDVEWENGLIARFTRGFSKNALYSTDVTNRFYGQREDVNTDYKSYKETEDGGKYALAYQRYAQMANYLTDIREYVNRADAAGDTELSVKILAERNDAIRALLNDTRTQEETEVDNWLAEKYVGSNTLFRPYNLKTEISVTQDVLGGKNKLTLALDYDMYQELYSRIDDAIYTTYLQLYRKEQAEDTAYYTDSDIQSAKNDAVKEVLNAYILENKSKAVTTPVADSSVTRYTASQVLSSDDPESVVRYNLSGYSDAAVEEAVSLFNTFSDDETLTESSVNAKITNLFPSETPKSFTAYRSDGQSETFEMTQLEQDEYAVRYQSAAQDAVNGLTNSRPWSDMNSDSKAKAYGYAFDYAAYQAKNETLDAAQSTLSASGSSSWLDKMETAMEECGISASDYVSLKAKLGEITAVGDTTGAQRKRAYIDSLGYKNSDALKESLGCPEPKGSTSSSTSSSAAYDTAAYKANLSTFSPQLKANSAYAYLTPEQKQTADGYLDTYARYAAHFYKDDDNDGVDDRQTQWIEKALASGVDMMTVLSARAAIADISGTGAADKKRVALAKMRSAGLITQSEYTKILKAFNLL